MYAMGKMVRPGLILLLAAILSVALIVRQDAPMRAEGQIYLRNDYPPFAVDRIIVKFRSTVRTGKGSAGVWGSEQPELRRLLVENGVQQVSPLFDLPSPLYYQADAGSSVLLSMARVYRLRLEPGRDVFRAVAALSADPHVEYAEPDYLARPADWPSSPGAPARWPASNDPRFGEQWGLSAIQVDGAWAKTLGSPAIAIAVLDSGVDLEHPDLLPNLWINPGEIAGNGLDDDGNGFVDDERGWNLIAGSNDVWDDNGHGTLVAGIAAARTGNGIGVAGVCGNCSIMPVKGMQPSGLANYSDIAPGVVYATAKGARVINMSLGGYADSKTLRDAIRYAVSQNVVVVGGVGNDNTSAPFYPAAYDEVIAVAGTTITDTRTAFTNYGTWVDVSAPGEDILTTALGSDYVRTSGTSMAAPFGAGLAGLLLSLHPDWTPALVRSQLMHTADTIDALNPGYGGQLGSGRLDGARAVELPMPILTYTGYAANGTPGGRPDFGASMALAVSMSDDWADASSVTGVLTSADPHVTVVSGTAAFGNILSGQTVSNPSPFSVTIATAAGYNHPIPFILSLSANDRTYSTTLAFTVTTRTSEESVAGTIGENTLWTSDKTYVVNNNIGVAPGVTLTIQPGTVVKFNGNYALNVGGTLIADGSPVQPIVFRPYSSGTWNRIYFDDQSADAVVAEDGTYQSGSLLRYVQVQGATGGLACNNATPYLAHLITSGGGITCTTGSSALWLVDSAVAGNVSVSPSQKDGRVWRSQISSGNLILSGPGEILTSTVGGSIRIGGGNLASTMGGYGVNGYATDKRIDVPSPSVYPLPHPVTPYPLALASTGTTVLANTASGSSTLSGSGRVENTTAGGAITLSSGAIVSATTTNGGISMGNGSVTGSQVNRGGITLNSGSVVSNTVLLGGISVGDGSTVHGNNVERSPGEGIQSSGTVTVTANRVVDAVSAGVVVSTGLVAGNIIANTGGDGLRVSAASVLSNTFTGVRGRAVYIQAGIPLTISGNNFAFNTGPHDLYNDDATGQDVAAQRNWWGTTDTAAIAGRIFDFYDDYNKGKVGYAPIMDAPSPDAPAYVSSVKLSPESPVGIQTVTFDMELSRSMDPGSRPGLRSEATAGLVWATRAPMPTARIGPAVAVVDERIFAVGGAAWVGIQGLPAAAVEEFDPTTNTWRARAALPQARDGLGIAVVNGKVYAIGGHSTNNGNYYYPAAVQEYDPATDIWRTRAPMPTGRERLGVVAAGDRIYAIGGYKSYTEIVTLATVEEYDPARNTWRTRTPMPTARSGFGVAEANGRIYAIGGHGSDWRYLATVEEYDPATDTWRTRSDLPTARGSLGAVAAGERIYAIGGGGNDWQFSPTKVEEYDAAMDRWEYRAPMPTPRASPGAAAVGGRIYAIGGFNDSSDDLSTVEEAVLPTLLDDFPDGEWVSPTRYRTTYDFTALAQRGAYTLTVSGARGADGIQIPPYLGVTFTLDYAGYVADTSPPAPPTVFASGRAISNTILARWSASDPQSGITLYRYAIGTKPGGTDVVNWTNTTAGQLARSGLSLLSGQTYYVSVKARNGGGIWSEPGVSNLVLVPRYSVFLPVTMRAYASGW